MNQNHICSICPKNDAKNPNAVCCDICNLSVHIKFNIITYNFYRKLGNDKETWNFKKCIKIIVSLSQLSDNQINKSKTNHTRKPSDFANNKALSLQMKSSLLTNSLTI